MNPQHIPNIYLPNKGAHDYSPAQSFGNFITLTEGPLKLTEVGYLNRIMEEKMEDSHPNDYILICGPTLANIIATAIFVHKHGRINLLIFRSTPAGPRYYERTIMLEDWLHNPETKEIYND
jgi:hypothetical protein